MGWIIDPIRRTKTRMYLDTQGVHWKRVLSRKQILDLYNAGPPKKQKRGTE